MKRWCRHKCSTWVFAPYPDEASKWHGVWTYFRRCDRCRKALRT